VGGLSAHVPHLLPGGAAPSPQSNAPRNLLAEKVHVNAHIGAVRRLLAQAARDERLVHPCTFVRPSLPPTPPTISPSSSEGSMPNVVSKPASFSVLS
jgi:hypothetical protein